MSTQHHSAGPAAGSLLRRAWTAVATLNHWLRARRASARENARLVQQWQWGYAVRADWADGSHMVTDWARQHDTAVRKARAAQTYWRAGPLKPREWKIVSANQDVLTQHRTNDHCTSPLCPSEHVPDLRPARPATPNQQ